MANQVDPNIRALLASGALTQHQVPSQAQVDEVRRVQGMQVRTNAAGVAGNVLHGTSSTPAQVIALARVVELYILGEVGDSAGPAPVQAGV